MADLVFPTIKPQKGDQPATLWQRIAIALSQVALLGNGNYDPQLMDLILPTLKPQKTDGPHSLLQRIAVSVAQIAANGGVTAGSKFRESFTFTGTLADNATFGFLKDDRDITVTAIQLSTQTAATGANITVDLINDADAELSQVGTLVAGARTSETVLGAPYVVSAGTAIRFKITNVGSGTAGANLTLTLVGTYSS